MSDAPATPHHDLAALRHEYATGGLSEDDLTPDPLDLFTRWFAEVRDGGLHEPNAMAVATVSPDGAPAVRMVLLKGYGGDGFRFFTNLASAKGRDLAAEPRCSLMFPWHELERQVRVEGHAVPLSREDVAAYFAVRPRGSQLGAWASHQSSVVPDRAALEASYDEAERRFEDVPDGELPPPEEWGGFRVVPERIEFWQGRRGRLHDRLVYVREADGWTTQRLAP